MANYSEYSEFKIVTLISAIPTDIVVSNILETSATVTWTNPGTDIIYININPGTDIIYINIYNANDIAILDDPIETTGITYNLTGLPEQTILYVTLQGKLTSGYISAESAPSDLFTTPTVSFQHNFSESSGNNLIDSSSNSLNPGVLELVTYDPQISFLHNFSEISGLNLLDNSISNNIGLIENNVSSPTGDLVSFQHNFSEISGLTLLDYSNNANDGIIETIPDTPIAYDATNITATSFTANYNLGANRLYLYKDDILESSYPIIISSTFVSITSLSPLSNYSYKLSTITGSLESYLSNKKIAVTVASTEEKIVYNSNSSGQWQTHTMNPDGTNKINITNDAAKEDHHTTYSLILDAFIFCRKVGSYYQIFRKERVSGVSTQLTFDSISSTQPSPSTDGTKIVYLYSDNAIKIINSSTGTFIQDITMALGNTVGLTAPQFNANDTKILSNQVNRYDTFRPYLNLISDNSVAAVFPGNTLCSNFNYNKTKVLHLYSSSFWQIWQSNETGGAASQTTSYTGYVPTNQSFNPDDTKFMYLYPQYSGNIQVSTMADPNTPIALTTGAFSYEINNSWLHIKI